jgi:hypothetical protein
MAVVAEFQQCARAPEACRVFRRQFRRCGRALTNEETSAEASR